MALVESLGDARQGPMPGGDTPTASRRSYTATEAARQLRGLGSNPGHEAAL